MQRRSFLRRSTLGFGSVALAGMLDSAANAETQPRFVSPFAPKRPHHAAKTQRVIFLCMKGGPSHIDMFDYKPQLATDDGKAVGAQEKIRLLGSLWRFARHGDSGQWVSELLPNLANQADELCMLCGMQTDNPEHAQALDFLHTGSFQFVRPSMGSWVLYGLGAINQNLPGFVAINPPTVLGGAKYYGSSFLPAAYQGTPIGGNNKAINKVKIRDIDNSRLTRDQQRSRLDLLQSINRDLLRQQKQSTELEGVIESFELGFRMQKALPDVMDISGESTATLAMYGMDQSASKNFGQQCLLARRMAEAGVRFIQVTDDGWDHHGGLSAGLPRRCAGIDKPIAGLIGDLKQRGMLDDTLVVWGGEFGRSPDDGTRDGRGHNAKGFTMFMAGGGVKRGIRHGGTDEYGRQAVEGQVQIHDLHATMLHLLGLDHEQLTYRYSGRDFRLTDVEGTVVKEILA